MTIMPRAVVRASRLLELANVLGRLPWALSLRRPRAVAAPVISVGNIALGGTGKTPLVAAIAAALLDRGAHPAVLTRGYRRREAGPVVVRGGAPDWCTVGDEPALLARAVPELLVVVDPDRVAGARSAITGHGATHLLLDDGFQHWRLARDLDIVVVDADDPLCAYRPRREHPRVLRRADLIVVASASSDSDRDAAEAALRRHAPGVRLVHGAVRPLRVHHEGSCEPPSSLAGRRLLAATGIAAPWRFRATLEALGAEVVGEVTRPDHHPWRGEEIEALLHAATARNALAIVTAKDIVKVPAELAEELAWLEVGLDLERGSIDEILTRASADD